MPESEAARDPRVFMAIERTTLAWTRTALALMGFGFVVARVGLLFRELAGDPGGGAQVEVLARSSHSLWLGTALVILGVAVQGIALVEHRHRMRQFRTGQSIVSGGLSLATSAGLALIGIGVSIVAYFARIF